MRVLSRGHGHPGHPRWTSNSTPYTVSIHFTAFLILQFYFKGHFHAILHDQADMWSQVAREATLLLSRELLTCPGTFQTIVTSLVFSEATVLYSVDLAIQKEHRLFSSTPMSSKFYVSFGFL